MSKKQTGLTLVELMVVVAVMAVIASVAYPLYTAQVQKSRRADAKIALQTVATAQERFYTVNGRYTANLASLQVSTDVQGGGSNRGYYDITLAVTGADSEQFTATADAASGGAQAGDGDCAQFTIDHLGVQAAEDSGGTANDRCW